MMDGNGTLALDPHDHDSHNDTRAAKRYKRQLPIRLSFSIFMQRASRIQKRTFDVFFVFCFAYFASLKSYGGKPERPGIMCFGFIFQVLFLFFLRHVELARANDLDDGTTWILTCCIL